MSSLYIGMPSIQLFFLILLGIFGTSVSKANVICSHVFDHRAILNSTDSLDSPLAKSLQQLEVRLIRTKELFDLASNELHRKVLKLERVFSKSLDRFHESGELSDNELEKIITLSEELYALEAQLNDLELAASLDPLRLRRILFTGENIDTNKVYHALDLPGFGPTKFYFSKSTADFFNKPGLGRDFYFPNIFKGAVAKQGHSGLKPLALKTLVNQKNIEWRVMELKVMGKEWRVAAIVREGEVHFYKVFLNHNRVDYIQKENILRDFLLHHYSNSSQDS